MQTRFDPARLDAEPAIAEAERILRKCVHCGFCTATCPTYVLLGDENDGPRGRIYMIREMLEDGGPAPPKVVKHIDRCLSCLSCMTTCPSGVDYMRLVDQARSHIERTHRRPFFERRLRDLLAWLVPRPGLFRLALAGAFLVRPFGLLLPGPAGALFAQARRLPSSPSAVDRPGVFPAEGPRRARVALLSGCAQQVLEPGINEATIRLLNRHGCEVVVAEGTGCCGALTHHMGREEAARAAARANVAAWCREADGDGLDAVVVNASGCGSMVKDYGHVLQQDTAYAADAARIAGLTRDIGELMESLGLMAPVRPTGLRVACHSACSLQHGQRADAAPKSLLRAAGFEVLEVPEGHLCCGSAGTYNLLQPALASRLRDRKVANIESLRPDLVAAGNIGCIAQIGGGTGLPVLHTVELLDWATGGPAPPGLDGLLTKS